MIDRVYCIVYQIEIWLIVLDTGDYTQKDIIAASMIIPLFTVLSRLLPIQHAPRLWCQVDNSKWPMSSQSSSRSTGMLIKLSLPGRHSHRYSFTQSIQSIQFLYTLLSQAAH